MNGRGKAGLSPAGFAGKNLNIPLTGLSEVAPRYSRNYASAFGSEQPSSPSSIEPHSGLSSEWLPSGAVIGFGLFMLLRGDMKAMEERQRQDMRELCSNLKALGEKVGSPGGERPCRQAVLDSGRLITRR